MQKMARKIGVIRKKHLTHLPLDELKTPRIERTAELCQLYGRRRFHSRVDNLRAQKYRADLARNRIVAIKDPDLCRTGLAADGTRPRPCEETKNHFVSVSCAFVRIGRLISIRRVNAKSGFTNNVVRKILLRSRAPCGFVRNLGRYNLAVNQDKRVARTSFAVSATNSAQNTHGDTQQSRSARD